MKLFNPIPAITFTFLMLLHVCAIFIFLNPFTWGMRRIEYHSFSEEFLKSVSIIEQDSLFTTALIDFPTEQYMRRCERGHLDKIENLTIHLYESNYLDTNFLNKRIDNYAEIALASLPQKVCFDSLVFEYSYKADSTIVKSYKVENGVAFFDKKEFIMENVRKSYKIKN